MANALLGLLHYEEKDGYFRTGAPRGNGQFLEPPRNGEEVFLLPRMFYVFPERKRVADHLEQAESSLEEELPEAAAMHLALRPTGNGLARRRKKKTVWTPFGPFVISELLGGLEGV